MPASPDLAAELARDILRLYSEAEAILLQKVARRLHRGITESGWAEQKLLEVQALRRDARAEVERLTEAIPQATDDAIRSAYNRGVAAAATDLEAIGVEIRVAFAAVDEVKIAALARVTMERLAATHLRILRWTDDAYRQVVAEASGQVLTGALSRREAAQAALNRFADKGITGFVDQAGRSWDLVSYAETAVRSSAGQAAVSGHLDRLADNGHDLVIVSDSPGECPLCRPWEGEILSISGRTTDYPAFADAEAAGLFHANCTHSTGLYVEGLTRPLRGTADPLTHEAKQQQRYLERGVRRWKRREAVGDSSAGPKVREWQSRLSQHVQGNDLKRLRYRETLGVR